MGQVRVGDVLFDERAQPCRVTATTEVMYGRDVYEVLFDDGSKIKADAEHRWITFTAAEREARARRTEGFRATRRAKRPRRGTGKRPDLAERNSVRQPVRLGLPLGTVRTTSEIAESLRVGRRTNHSVPLAGALQLPSADLPLEPYALGLWLGDGSSQSGGFTTADPELLDAFRAAGYSPRLYRAPYSYYIDGLRTALGRLGLIGNKHIPRIYLDGSEAQRRALLAGLMDTDGTVLPSGACEFYTCNERLAREVHELCLGLGLKCSVRTGRAKLNGKDCGPKYRIKFTTTDIVCRLGRKAARQTRTERGVQRQRYIVDVRPIPSEPVRCIAVDSPSHLYLAGRTLIPTHNSDALLLAGIIAGLSFPGAQIGYFRRTFAELEGSGGAIIRSKELLSGHAKYTGDLHRWVLPTGSLLTFCHCKDEDDVYSYQSQQFDVLLIDEATHFTEKQVAYLHTRNRLTVNIPAPICAMASNPGNVGHTWFLRLFQPEGQMEMVRSAQWDGGAEPFTTAFLPAKLSDNQALERRDPKYRQRLESQPEHVRAQLLDGRWDAFDGQAFPEFRHQVHVVKPFPIPAWWRRWRANDPGYSDPFAWYWLAADEDGNVYIYREFTRLPSDSKLSYSEQAARVAVLSVVGTEVPGRPPEMAWDDEAHELRPVQEHINFTVTGMDAFNAHPDTGKAHIDYYADGGLKGFIKPVHGSGARAAMAATWHEYLKVFDGPDGRPTARLKIFSTCRRLIEMLPQLVVDERNPEAVADGNDDQYQAAGYGLQAWHAERSKPPEAERGVIASHKDKLAKKHLQHRKRLM